MYVDQQISMLCYMCCRKESLLTLREQLTAAGGHHRAVFGGLTMRTGRQLDVIAAVTVHKQAGQENRKNINTCTHVF